MKILVLFSDTYPYGTGETFLADELPYVVAKFDKVTIRPLHAFGKKGEALRLHRPLPLNVTVGEPLLPFDDKNRKALVLSGLFSRKTLLNTAPLFFAVKEFFTRVLVGGKSQKTALLGLRNHLNSSELHNDVRCDDVLAKKAPLKKRLWIFFNYLFILRSILGNKPLIKSLLCDCAEAQALYFFWGDKSAMTIPFLKKRLAKIEFTHSLPTICVRFNGSDCYEEAKGYLPFRERIYAATDLGVTVSKSLEQYIKQNYKYQPKILKTSYLGSQTHAKAADFQSETVDNQIFRILSCSNVIELKRVHLILEALKLLTADEAFLQTLEHQGYTTLEWVHFGSGPLLENLKTQATELQSAYNNATAKPRISLNINLKGQTPHAGVMRFYAELGGDIFLLLSRSEGLGVCLLEALSYGIPIIATAVGGIPEIFATAVTSSESANNIGYLLEPNPTAKKVAQTIKAYATLSKNIRLQMRQISYNQWCAHWDGAKLHTAFASELAKL